MRLRGLVIDVLASKGHKYKGFYFDKQKKKNPEEKMNLRFFSGINFSSESHLTPLPPNLYTLPRSLQIRQKTEV